jgi:hypothetical protein
MTKDDALKELRNLEGDTEKDHARADAILLELIDDDEIRAAYEAIEKWYA